MKKSVHIFLFLVFSIGATVAFGQGEISISSLATGVSASPVSGSTTDIAVFGISFDKAAGATSEVTQVIIQLSSNPVGKFSNPRLYRSNNSDFDGVGSETLVSTGAMGSSPDIFTFVGTPITDFSVAGTPQTSAQTRNFFIVVDVDPSVDGSTPTIAPSVSEVDISAATSVVVNTFSGITYSFTGITPTITSVNPGSSTCVGETITISGTGFSSPTVTINGVTATISSSNTTQIQITAPGGAAIGVHPIVVENSNGNSDNSSSYTIKPAINSSINVGADNPNPIPNQNFNILVGGGTQAGVSYRVRRISPTVGSYSTSQNGNGGVLSFGPYAYNPPTPTVYVYEVQAQSSGCGNVTLSQTATITIAAITADAGPPTASVCDGDGMILGGSPTVSGGTGFYMVSWTSSPGSFTSTATNPVVSPTVTTTYTVTVTDSNGDSDSDDILVTVNPRTDPDDLDIVFTPAQNSYSVNDGPVDLSFTVAGGGGGTPTYSGDGVNSTTEKFFPSAASVGSNQITLTFVNTDNCETIRTETVDVYDPSGFISGLAPLYCPEGIDDLTVNIPPGYLSFQNIFLLNPSFVDIPAGSGWTKNLATRQVQINLSQLPIGRNYFRIQYTRTGIVDYIFTPYFDFSCFCIRYTITPVYGPVVTYVYVPLNIKAPPVAKIGFKTLTTDFCNNSDIINLEGSPIGGIWLGPGVTPANGNDNLPSFTPGDNGLATFNPATAAIGNNLIRYIFRDADGCRDTANVVFNVFNTPTISFTAPNGCVGDEVQFTPSVSIPPGITVSKYVWDFGDGRSESSLTLTNPTFHTFTSSQDYDVTLTAITADNCPATFTETIPVGDIPDLALTWRGVCEDEVSAFEINSDFFDNTINLVDELHWDFGDGDSYTRVNPTAAQKIIPHSYATTGYYTAHATLTSDLGCTNTQSINVYKVSSFGVVSDLNEYMEDFNDVLFEDQGWKTGGQNTSWEWGPPIGMDINGDSPSPVNPGSASAWVTNLLGSYNENEDSWVHSPCFDLSVIERPVISFDFQFLTREQLDGVVLQINSTNTTDDETEWKNVGVIGEGKNWFNTAGIFANPGNQTILQSGWSGQQNLAIWKEAVYSLDDELPLNINNRTKIRFRFAFASLGQSSTVLPEGFAFDNVKISQRDRLVLLESFTNTGGNDTPTEPNKVANQIINTNFLTETEVVKIEYHVGIGGPNIDSLYLHNTQDANARAAYYGVTATPFAFLDSRTGNFNSIFNEQKLSSAKATIDTIITDISLKDLVLNRDRIQVLFTPKTDLPANTVLRIVVVEKSIPYNGSNGETEFTYVMKQMLPSAVGIKYENILVANAPVSETVYWPPPSKIYNANELAVIAFLQNDLTQEVYQAKILSTLNYNPYSDPMLITAIEPGFIDRIIVYPNPAKSEINIQLPASLAQQLPAKLIDSYGREVHHSFFKNGDTTKTISLAEFAAGVYILQIESNEGVLLRKKVMVIH